MPNHLTAGLTGALGLLISLTFASPADAGPVCKPPACATTEGITTKKPIIPADKKKMETTKKTTVPAEKPTTTDKVAVPEAAKP